MTAATYPPAGTPITHAPGEDALGGCEARIYTTCRACRGWVVWCHPSDQDVAAIMRRGWRHAACSEGGA